MVIAHIFYSVWVLNLWHQPIKFQWNVKQLGLRLWSVTINGILVVFFFISINGWHLTIQFMQIVLAVKNQKKKKKVMLWQFSFLFYIIILLVRLWQFLHEGNFSRGIVPCNLYESLQNKGEPSYYCMPTNYRFSELTLLSLFRSSTILAMTSRLFLLFLLVLTSNDPINILIGLIPFPQNHKPNQKLRATSIRKLVLHTWNYTTPI